MNKFECTVILVPTITETKQREIANEIMKLLSQKVLTIDSTLRTLAYEIKGYKQGYFITLNFEQTDKKVAKLEKYLLDNKFVLKFIVIRKGDDEKC